MLYNAPCNGLLRGHITSFMKRVSQIGLMLLVLLMQSAPLMKWTAPAAEKCPMACCAWLMEAGLGDCSCEATPVDHDQPKPAPLPSSSSSGRDFTSQVVWVEQSFHPITFPTREQGTTQPGGDEHTPASPHVRLTVLFCSFLT